MSLFVSYNSEKSIPSPRNSEGLLLGIVQHTHPSADEIICSPNFFDSNNIIETIQKIESCTSFLAIESGRERMEKNHVCEKLLDKEVKADQTLRKILLQQLAKLKTNQKI